MDIFRRNRHPKQDMLYNMTDNTQVFNVNTKCKQKQCDIKVVLSWNEIIIKIINKQPDYSYTIKPMLQ